MVKIINDKYYTPKDLAKRLIDTTIKVLVYNGVNDIEDIIEPSAGNGAFSSQIKCTANGIEPIRLKPILDKWSELLNKYDVQFINQSYDTINPFENDFLYLDPPYANTKGMYYGTIEYDKLWNYLKNCKSDYFLSFDGIAGEENNIYNVPNELYNKHILLNSGNSSFRRVIGNSNDTNVYESLYIKVK